MKIGCEHGRPEGVPCPHCMGTAQRPAKALVTEVADGSPEHSARVHHDERQVIEYLKRHAFPVQWGSKKASASDLQAVLECVRLDERHRLAQTNAEPERDPPPAPVPTFRPVVPGEPVQRPATGDALMAMARNWLDDWRGAPIARTPTNVGALSAVLAEAFAMGVMQERAQRPETAAVSAREKALHSALRSVAVIRSRSWEHGVERQRWRCECGGEWDHGQPEAHLDDCLVAPLEKGGST